MSVKLQNFSYDVLNLEIYKRNLASQNIDMNFDPRPVNTKYRHLPIIDPNLNNNNFNFNQIYNDNVFFPGNTKPHYSGLWY